MKKYDFLNGLSESQKSQRRAEQIHSLMLDFKYYVEVAISKGETHKFSSVEEFLASTMRTFTREILEK